MAAPLRTRPSVLRIVRDERGASPDRALSHRKRVSGTTRRHGELARALSTTSSLLFSTVTNMPRPRIYDEPRIATAIRLPASLRDELQSAATQREVSVNFLVTRAVLDYLERLPALGPDPSDPQPHRRAKVSS